MKKNCLKCSKEFLKKGTCSKKEWATSKFCSHSCSNSFNAIGNKYRLGKSAWNKGKKFPERSGDNNPRNSRVSMLCKECMEVFEVQNHRKETAKFCSVGCTVRHQDQGKTAGNYRIRRSKAYSVWRTIVFERDNYTCQMCGVRGGHLNADHIKPFAYYPELRLEVSNGRTLCLSCHKETPTYGVGAWVKLQTLSAVSTQA